MSDAKGDLQAKNICRKKHARNALANVAKAIIRRKEERS